jgi:hypothetical protein
MIRIKFLLPDYVDHVISHSSADFVDGSTSSTSSSKKYNIDPYHPHDKHPFDAVAQAFALFRHVVIDNKFNLEKDADVYWILDYFVKEINNLIAASVKINKMKQEKKSVDELIDNLVSDSPEYECLKRLSPEWDLDKFQRTFECYDIDGTKCELTEDGFMLNTTDKLIDHQNKITDTIIWS